MHDKEVSRLKQLFFYIYLYICIYYYILLSFFNRTYVLLIKMTHTTTNCQTADLKFHCKSITVGWWQNQVQVNLEDFFFPFIRFFFSETNCFYNTKQLEAPLNKLLLQLKIALSWMHIMWNCFCGKNPTQDFLR